MLTLIAALTIVQLDLARQMETTSFVSNYIDRVSSYGYNALELYLEGRVGTKTFSLPPAERYTPDQMRGIVAHAAEKGMIVIPVVSFLGHAEKFFKYPGLESICETREGHPRLGNGNDTFCHSAPEALVFFENYIADLCAIFPDPYFHAGFDEAWNAGTCSLCAPKERRDVLFTEEVLNIHRILKRHGKRMMMWDDFLGFHTNTLAQLPRDIVMMHWCYDADVTERGTRFNFTGHAREDDLAHYAALGFDAIPCAWYDPDNIRTTLRYARRGKTAGYLQTQWEDHIPNFHGGSLPRVLAAALMLRDPILLQGGDAFAEAVARLFPALSHTEQSAVVRLLKTPDDSLALEVLEGSPFVRNLGPVASDPLCERALLDDILCRARRAVLEARQKRAETLLANPRRNAEDVAAAKRLLEPLPVAGRALAERRAAQFAAWRKGCLPEAVTNAPMAIVRASERLLASAACAQADEKRLVVELTLNDVYGIPRWTVEGLFAEGWREIARGNWKPASGGGASFTKYLPFKSAALPTALRFSYSGYGTADLRFAAVEDRDSYRTPKAVRTYSGAVANPAAILRDDFETVRFGRPGFLKPFFDENVAKAVSVLEVELK